MAKDQMRLAYDTIKDVMDLYGMKGFFFLTDKDEGASAFCSYQAGPDSYGLLKAVEDTVGNDFKKLENGTNIDDIPNFSIFMLQIIGTMSMNHPDLIHGILQAHVNNMRPPED